MKYEQYKNYPTEPGWYCIGWDREDKDEQAEFGPHMEEILEFTGSDWLTESGDAVDHLWHPGLQCRVAMDAADYYFRQN